MEKGKSVLLERVTGRENEYIIKDKVGITVGRVYIIEMTKENKYCSLRLKCYRTDNYDILKDVLIILLRTLLRNRDINKVNVLIDELIDTKAFTDIGFSLEGIVEESIFSNGIYRSELIFGINSADFQNIQKFNGLKLKGKNIDLRILTPESSQEVFQYTIRNRDYLRYYEPLRDQSFYTLEVQRKILNEEYKHYLNGASINCGIYRESVLIGKIRLSNIVQGVFRNAFLGYSMDEKEQGKGFMKEAVNTLIEYAFSEMELHRVEASTLVDNIKSQRVLLSSGFKELGINKEYLFINGGWRDHVTFYKTNTN